ncbi:MAG TPA: helix-turn-helix domain-containing protein [Dehalococcoidia bacterium]|nr:helix-turn-helix domain-containing protein [Dehalococcoidia bacterium]
MSIFTPEEAADRWKVSTKDVLHEVENGVLLAFKVGENLRFTEEALLAFERRPESVKGAPARGDRLVNSAVSPSTANSRIRSRNLEYRYLDGFWLGARALLEALERDNHPFAAVHRQSFETVLRGSGNGMSNLAKEAAKQLSLESRERR